MKKLVFYGGGYDEHNVELHEELLRLSERSRPKIRYIPSHYEDSRACYEEFCEFFDGYGVKSIKYRPIDQPLTTNQLDKIFNTDIIFLSGGNTFYFLHHLKKSGAFTRLKKFVNEGGVLGGLSAGAIMMTSNINTASFPKFDCDENEIELKNLNSLDLVNFHFFPHYENTKRYRVELIKYSLELENKPLFACPDYSGIVVEGEKLSFIGESYTFYHGQNFRL